MGSSLRCSVATLINENPLQQLMFLLWYCAWADASQKVSLLARLLQLITDVAQFALR